jgi:hypothetical protein
MEEFVEVMLAQDHSWERHIGRGSFGPPPSLMTTP